MKKAKGVVFMIIRCDEMTNEVRCNMRGGAGEVLATTLFEQGVCNPKIKLFKVLTLEQGAGIGYHVHENEQEMFYVLSGRGEYNDNGALAVLNAGDSCITKSGEGHGVCNREAEPLKLLALIITD